MRKCFLLFLTGLSLMGCSSDGLSGKKPPETTIEIGNKTFETTLGTYCWGNTCVDTAGPIDLLEGKEPIKVKQGEIISLVMDYNPKPNEFYLGQISENKETEVVMKDNQFSAPTQKGVYYYSYGVWWMDDKAKNVSNGDSFYAFAIEVN